MLRTILVLTLLGILAAIGCGLYFAADYFWWKPQRELALEEEMANRQAPPDPSIAAWEELAAILPSATAPTALNSLREYLATYPQSPHLADALEALNAASRRILFTNEFPDRKIPYTVVRGDAMAKISSRQKVNPDWILKVNNLLGHELQVGQTLLLPNTEVRLVLRPTEGVLEVWELPLPVSTPNADTPAVEDELLLVYPLTLSGITPPSPGTTAIRDRIASRDGAAIAFGSPGYAGAERTINFERSGLALEEMPPPSDDPASQAAMPTGLLLESADLRELFLLVKKGTPVSIN